MKSSTFFKIAMWAAVIYACGMLWAYIIYRPWLLIAYFFVALGAAVLAYFMMRDAQKNGL